MTHDMTATEAAISRVVELRKRKGWNAQQLAEAMQAAGFEWTRMVVAKLETRKRQLNVNELVALSYVLDVAPVHLLVPPDMPASDIYVVTPGPEDAKPGRGRKRPGYYVDGDTARRWIRGEAAIGAQDPRTYGSEVPAAEWSGRGKRQ